MFFIGLLCLLSCFLLEYIWTCVLVEFPFLSRKKRNNKTRFNPCWRWLRVKVALAKARLPGANQFESKDYYFVRCPDVWFNTENVHISVTQPLALKLKQFHPKRDFYFLTCSCARSGYVLSQSSMHNFSRCVSQGLCQSGLHHAEIHGAKGAEVFMAAIGWCMS